MTENIEDIIKNDRELIDLKNQYEIEKEIEKEKQDNAKKEYVETLEYRDYIGEDEVIPNSLIIQKIKARGEKRPSYFTGYTKIDEIIEGFDEEELIVLSGVTGNGKTLFARSLTYQFALNTNYSVWFSYEESNEALIGKFHNNNVPLFYLPKKNIDTQLKWIEKRIIESKVKYATRIAFIDHLHFLIPLKYVINTSILIGGIMRELKKIAIRNKVIIFLIAHTSKVQQSDIPDLSQIRDSSFIAQEADRVFFIKRHGTQEGDRMVFDNNNSIYVLKNRKNGKLGTVSFYFNYEDGILNENTI